MGLKNSHTSSRLYGWPTSDTNADCRQIFAQFLHLHGVKRIPKSSLIGGRCTQGALKVLQPVLLYEVLPRRLSLCLPASLKHHPLSFCHHVNLKPHLNFSVTIFLSAPPTGNALTSTAASVTSLGAGKERDLIKEANRSTAQILVTSSSRTDCNDDTPPAPD